ncbi:MAG: zf-HC2 domain-containing protein [Peptococcaceae bacterium]
MHITEGLLQEYLDHETTELHKEMIEKHLRQCSLCSAKLTELRELGEFVDNNLAEYTEQIEKIPAHTKGAYERFTSLTGKHKWKGLVGKMLNYRKLAAGLAVTIIFATTFFLPPVRQAAADFLHIFRVQKVETVQLNIEDLNKIRDEFMNKVGEIDLKQLGKAAIISQPQTEVMPLADTLQIMPFAVKYPADYDLNSDVEINGEFAVDLTLNISEVNNVLRQLGSHKLLPEELDGKSFSIYSPGQVGIKIDGGAIIAGEDVRLVVDGERIPPDGVKIRNGNKNFVYFSQIGSPEFTVPDGVDIAELQEVLLDVPIIPSGLKDNLKKIQDWQHTLVVPTAGNNEIVRINGEKAVLEQTDYGSTLFWVSDGVIYSLSGSQDADLVEIADHLRDLQ